MGFDSILNQVGQFGLYQRLLCGLFVFYTTFLCGLNYYTQVSQELSEKVRDISALSPGFHLREPGPQMFRRSARLLPNRDLCKLGRHVALDPAVERIPKVASTPTFLAYNVLT